MAVPDTAMMEAQGQFTESSQAISRGQRRVRILWLVLIAIVAALFCIPYAATDLANGDLLLSPVMATQKLTFFFWDQNRLANLVPALSYVVRDPFANAYVQMFITGASFFGLLVFVQRAAFGQADDDRNQFLLPAATLCAVGIFLLVTQAVVPYTFGYEQPYGTSLFAYLLASWLLFNRSSLVMQLLGVPVMIVALLVNPATILFAGLVVPVAIAYGKLRSVPAYVLSNAVAVVASVLASKSFGTQTSAEFYTKIEADGALEKWKTVWSHLWVEFHQRSLVAALLLSGVAIALNWKRLSNTARLLVLLLPPFAMCWTGLFGLIAWVRMNGYHFRYFVPVYLAVLALLLIGVTSAFELARSWVPRLDKILGVVYAAPLAVALGATFVMWTPLSDYPSVARVQGQIDYAENNDVRFFGGSFMSVWPSVLAIEESGRDVFGIALRGVEMRDEVNAEVDSLVRAGQPIKLMCADISQVECVDWFRTVTGRGGWEVVGIANSEPLVVIVADARN